MIEILILVNLTRKLSGIAEQKGRSKSWGLLFALMWIVGEIIGFIIGFGLGMEMGAYGLALACAVVGGTIAWFLVKSLAPGGMVAAYAESGAQNPHYDPKNPWSPPRAQ